MALLLGLTCTSAPRQPCAPEPAHAGCPSQHHLSPGAWGCHVGCGTHAPRAGPGTGCCTMQETHAVPNTGHAVSSYPVCQAVPLQDHFCWGLITSVPRAEHEKQLLHTTQPPPNAENLCDLHNEVHCSGTLIRLEKTPVSNTQLLFLLHSPSPCHQIHQLVRVVVAVQACLPQLVQTRACSSSIRHRA